MRGEKRGKGKAEKPGLVGQFCERYEEVHRKRKSGSVRQIPKSKVNGKVHLLSSVLEADSMERMILQITEKLFYAGVWIGLPHLIGEQ